MEDIYRFNDGISSGSENVIGVENAAHMFYAPADNNNLPQYESSSSQAAEVVGMSTRRLEMSDLIKTQIANHPRYPDLVSAHIQCRKVIFLYFNYTIFSLFLFFS